MPAVTIADAVQISDSPDAKAVLQADSTTKYFLPPRMTTAQKNLIVSPAEGAIVFDTDLNRLYEYTGSAWQAAGGGGSPPFDDGTAIIKGSADATKLLRIEIDGFTTGTTRVATPPDEDFTMVGVATSQTLSNKILSQLQLIIGGFKAIFTHSNSADRTYTLPNYNGTLATVAGAETLTNKTLDADGTGNVITNIGSSEVKAELITGLSADATPDSAADYVMTYDASATALKKVLLEDFPTGSVASYAILEDQKATTVGGGSASAATWNNRTLSTEVSDADSIVAVSSNQFTPVSGTYLALISAPAALVNRHRLRLYNVTGAASVKEGAAAVADATNSVATTAHLKVIFTANGTNAYRIDHYTQSAQATVGLGSPTSDGSTEVYLTILLIKLS